MKDANVPEGYKSTDIGIIPKDWNVYTIKETLKLINGCAFKPKDWKNQGLPIIRIQNLNDSTAPFNYCDTKVDQRYHVSNGDLLFAWSGTKDSSFGARIWHGTNAILNQHIFKVVPYKDKVTLDYALLVLLKVQEDIEKKAHGFKASFVHIKKSDLEITELPLPPLPEQKKIASVLSDVDDLIRECDSLLAKKRDIKQGTMQQLLTGKKRLPGFSGEWEEKKLGDITNIDVDNLKSDTNRNYSFKYISLEDVERGKLKSISECVFASAPSRARRKVKINDVLVATVRPNLQSHLFIKNDVKNLVCSTGFSVIRCDPNITNAEFIYHHFFAEIIETQFNTLLVGSNYPAVNSSDIKNLKLPIPTLPEQKAIAQILSDMDAEIEALEQKRDKYKAIKQGMMQELLTGKTRLIDN